MMSNDRRKARMIDDIIRRISCTVKHRNQFLIRHGLPENQIGLSEGDLFLRLAFLPEKQLEKILKEMGG